LKVALSAFGFVGEFLDSEFCDYFDVDPQRKIQRSPSIFEEKVQCRLVAEEQNQIVIFTYIKQGGSCSSL